MGKTVFIILSQFLLIYLQLELGNLGWPLPLALMGALYTALALGGNWGIGAALLSGSLLCALYGGGFNALLVIIHPLLAGLLCWWIERHDEDVRPDFFIPGIWAGIAGTLPAFFSFTYYALAEGRVPGDWLFFLLRMLWSIAVSGGIFTMFIFIGEACTEFMGLPRFLTRKGGHKR